MQFTHREEERAGQRLDALTNEELGLRIVVSRLGAELVSLVRRDAAGEWIGFLHRDNDVTKPASGWANHATVMGYFLHRLKDERSLYRGRVIQGGTHSFLRHKLFTDVTVNLGSNDGASITYHLSPNEIAASEYPLKVSLALTYALRANELHVDFHFCNHEPDLTAHLEFGLHPGFAATSFDGFRLEMPAGHYRRWLSPDNFLSGETEELNFPGGEMPFDRSKLPASYILELVNVRDRAFIYRDPASDRQVSLNFAEVPFVTIWSDGGPFLCIEPCWGLTDHHQQRPFEDKAGIQRIEAGGELRAGFTIVPELTATADR